MKSFYIRIFVKIFFKDQDYSKFTGGLDSVEYGIFLLVTIYWFLEDYIVELITILFT